MFKKLCMLLAVMLVVANIAVAQNGDKEQAAVKAAESWLTIVDSGDYAKSYEQSAAFFQNAVKPEQWDQSLKAVRAPLGKLVSRKVTISKYATSMQGAPDGEYVLVQFETSFENKQTAVETVTPMLDKDGQWHVAGYYIK